MFVPFHTILLCMFNKVHQNKQQRSVNTKIFDMSSHIHTNTHRALYTINCFSLRSPIEIKKQREYCYQNGGMKGVGGGQVRRFSQQMGWLGDVLHFLFLQNHDCSAQINIKNNSHIFQRILAHPYHPSYHHTTTIPDWLLLGQWW